MLASKFKLEELHKDLVPKTTWDSHAKFNKYKLSTFRSHLYKMTTNYGSAIVPYVPTSTNEVEDEDRENLVDNSGDSLTPAKKSISESKYGNKHNISLFNDYILAPWLHPETGRN